MQTSVIRHRVADFLKCHAPFDVLSEQDLLDLAGSGRVKFHESDEYIFRQGDPKGHLVWVIQQGRVELLEESASGAQLRDVLGEGDILALERFAGEGGCLSSARTATDVILYGVASATFEPMVHRYPLVQRFLAAHLPVPVVAGFGGTSWLDAEPPPIEFLRARLVKLPPGASSADIESGLTGSRSGVVALVDANGHLVSTATTGGTRKRPPTTGAPLTTRTALREMIQAGTEALAITTDGTQGSPLEAIITASELALFCDHNPAGLVSAIRHAGSAAEIAPLLKLASRLTRSALARPADVEDCCGIAAGIVAALASACIRLANRDVLAAGIDEPEIRYCWVMFGESARSDLLQPAAPTIAAVYDDSGEPLRVEDGMYFTAVAGETMAWFKACGLDLPESFWPEGSLPGMPLSEWKRFFSETIRQPLIHNLHGRREFFDVKAVSGDYSILERLKGHLAGELRESEMAIPLLANDTLAHLPPLTFFRGLVLDLDGAQRESFDIGNAALSPIAGAARVFALARGSLTTANTLARLEAAADDFPPGSDIFREAAEAFRIALYYQTQAGASRIHPGKLAKFDQRLLKNAFSSILRLLEFTSSMLIAA